MFFPCKDLHDNFPTCPSQLHPSGLVLTDGPSLDVIRDDSKIGSWLPISSSAVQIFSGDQVFFLAHIGGDTWKDYSTNTRYAWFTAASKRKRPHARASTVISTPSSATKRLSSRGCVLPLSNLDIKHRQLVDTLGVRVCMHSEVGRVLVSSRSFEQGSSVIFSRLATHAIATEEALAELVKPGDPPGSYICVPRTGLVYYNLEFCPEDPISSGDIWYLLNHSDHPNCELKAHACGLIIRAKRGIRENEPLTWAYNSGYFGNSDVKVDLPSQIIPDETTIFQLTPK